MIEGIDLQRRWVAGYLNRWSKEKGRSKEKGSGVFVDRPRSPQAHITLIEAGLVALCHD